MSEVPKEKAERLALRANPRPVTRLNRRLLIVVAGIIALGVMLALMWGLRKPVPRSRESAQQTPNVQHVEKAEGLAALPRDYASLPKPAPPLLGAPMGELGRPILKAEREAGIPILPGRPDFHPNPEEDAARAQRLKERSESEEAARASVFSQLQRRSGAQESRSQDKVTPVIATGPEESLFVPSADPNGQVKKSAFVDRKADSRIHVSASLQRSKSPHQLMAGTIIAAALLSGIKSDLPGEVIATVTENVFDSITGIQLLIPQGARVLGQYDSQVSFGQRRVLLVWTRLILPDGSSIVLDRLPGVDPQGYAGLEDGVDWHWRRIFAGAVLSSVIGAGAELAAPNRTGDQNTVVVATRESVQDTINHAGQELTRRNLDVQATLTERPGLPFRIVVNRDLTLRPYKS